MNMDTSTTRPSTVVGVFEDHEEAHQAIEALKDEGFTRIRSAPHRPNASVNNRVHPRRAPVGPELVQVDLCVDDL